MSSKLPALAALLALALLPSAAQAQTTLKKTVPGTVVFQNGQAPNDPGNCSALVFVQWSHPASWKVTQARADYTFDGKPGSQAAEGPAFNDTTDWVKVYTVPAGSHWILVGKSWGDGPVADDCSAADAKHRAWYAPQAKVELTIDNTEACQAAYKQQTKADKALRKARVVAGRARRASPEVKARAQAKLKKAKADVKKAKAAIERECSSGG